MNVAKRSEADFLENEDGGVVLWAALFFAMLGIGAVAIDLSMAYVAKQRAQIVSDAAVVAAAGTQSPIVDKQASPQAIAAANNIAEINGYSLANVTTVAAPSPRGDGTLALKTVIGDDVRLGFGLYSSTGRSKVGADSWAAANSSSTGGLCSGSLAGPTNIYGNAVVNGPNCTFVANTYFYACGQASVSIAGVQVAYTQAAEAPYLCSTATLQPKPTFKYSTPPTDTFAADSRIVNIKATMQAMANAATTMSATWPFGTTSPVRPTASGGTVAVSYNASVGTYSDSTGSRPINGSLPQSAYSSLSVGNSDVTFAGNGGPDPDCKNPTVFGGATTLSSSNITLGSGCYYFIGSFIFKSGPVTLNPAPGAEVVIVFGAGASPTVMPDATAAFGDATVYVNGGSITISGTSLKFGNGPFYLWGGTIYNNITNSKAPTLQFGNGPFYFYGGSVNNNGTMIYGDGPFYFQGGSLTANAGSTTVFGKGPFDFYGGSVTNSGTMTWGDGRTRFNGGTLTFNANTTTTLGVGDMLFYGGGFTGGFHGNVTIGNNGDPVNGSGTVYLQGGTMTVDGSLTANGVTFGLLGGTLSILGNGNLNITAPTGSSPTLGYQDVLFALWGGAFNLYQQNSPTATMAGLIYNPLGNVSIYHDQKIVMPAGSKSCFQVIANVLDIYENANVQMAPCESFNGGSGSVANAGALLQ